MTDRIAITHEFVDETGVTIHPCDWIDGGGFHDEAFGCDVCDRLVCGVCATINDASDYLCPDHAALDEEDADG